MRRHRVFALGTASSCAVALVLGSGAVASATPAAPGQLAADPFVVEKPEGGPAAAPEIDQSFADGLAGLANDLRALLGAPRLHQDPELAEIARARAAELAVGDPTIGEVPVPEEAIPYERRVGDRTVLSLPPGTTPEQTIGIILWDEGMRVRMLDGQFAAAAAGAAYGENGRIHLVHEFRRHQG